MTDQVRGPVLSLRVNGKVWEGQVEPDETLLDVLHDRVGLLGTRRNCEQGECGACTVLLDGSSVNSCLVLAASAQDREVTTIEGLRHGDQIDVLQEAFVSSDASQCGFCTSGLIMAAKALLNENPDPTRDEVKAALLGNYCRCTGYEAIVEAVASRIAPEGTEPWIHNRHHAAGDTAYISDLTVPDMLHGALVTLPVPRAVIRDIDTTEAAAHPGIVKIFTAADFPDGVPRFGPVAADQPILAGDVTKFEGEPVALVVAETEREARTAAKAVRVDYDPLPGIITWEQACSDDLVHDPAGRVSMQAKWADSNVMGEWAFNWGEKLSGVEAHADLVIENTYEVPFAHHFHLEPHGTVCVPGEDGEVTIYTPIQHPFVMRRVVASMLGLSEDAVRVRATDSGGAFGGKGYPKLEPLAAACALRLRRPLKVLRTSEESFLLSQREAAHIHIRSGFGADGGLIFQDIDADFLVGAYTDISVAVVSKSTLYALGPYRTPHARVRGRGLFTTTAPTTAFRGFGAPHMALALEGQMNEAARRLGIDPFEIRLRNARHKGDEIVAHDTPVDGDWPELLRRVAAEANWGDPLPPGRGRGIAYGMKVNSAATTSSARVELSADGTAVAFVGTTEMGQGQRDTVRMLVAEALELPIENITAVMGDTGVVPFDSWTASSRSTVFMGNALRAACEDIRMQLCSLASEQMNVPTSEVSYENGTIAGRSQSVGLADLVQDGVVTGEGTFSAPSNPNHPLGGPAPFYELVATAVELHIDRETGLVTIDKIVHGGDVGKVINRTRAGRLDEGGLIMGQSLALSEQLIFDEAGRLRNGSSLDYRIATVADLPSELHHIFQENADGPGPFGAKGLAEGGILAVAPAICGAIMDLTGVNVTEIPVTPERLWRMLKEREALKQGSAAAV